MTAYDRANDPRTIVTQDAFSVTRDLLGVPLAQHPRRVVAILLDLLLIALLTNLPGFLLGLLAAAFLMRMSMKRKAEAAPSPMRVAFRGTVGCFGGVILLVTVLVIFGVVQDRIAGDRSDGSDESSVVATTSFREGLTQLAGGALELRAYRSAADAESARVEGMRLLERLERMAGPLSEEELRDFLLDTAPEEAPWRGEIGGWDLGAAASVGSAGDAEAAGDVAAAGDDEAAAEGAAASADGQEAPAPSPFALELPPEVLDSLRALESRVAVERSRRESSERALVQTRRELESEQAVGAVRRFLRRFAEDLGLGFGWGALYFSVFMVWWKGRTPGKRFMRLRVVRLDGKPVTWWNAFERYGGYAAGFATGLFGFAQVFWDPNRQAIHDKISGTVVIQDGKPPVPGRWTGGLAPQPPPSS